MPRRRRNTSGHGSRGGRGQLQRTVFGALIALAVAAAGTFAPGLLPREGTVTPPAADAPASQQEASAPDAAPSAPAATASGASAAVPAAWDEAAAPNYVLVVGKAQVDTSIAPGSASYTGLDAHGRTGSVRACVTEEMARDGAERERANISDIHPSGWPADNPRVAIALPGGHFYHGELFNRSHLLAKSLGGKDERENLVTGTRMQNVGANDDNGGMAYCESRARSWLEAHPTGHLYYDATPHYEGAELLCRYVVVDMLSSDGTLNERVVVYNAAKGFALDYATGGWKRES